MFSLSLLVALLAISPGEAQASSFSKGDASKVAKKAELNFCRQDASGSKDWLRGVTCTDALSTVKGWTPNCEPRGGKTSFSCVVFWLGTDDNNGLDMFCVGSLTVSKPRTVRLTRGDTTCSVSKEQRA